MIYRIKQSIFENEIKKYGNINTIHSKSKINKDILYSLQKGGYCKKLNAERISSFLGYKIEDLFIIENEYRTNEISDYELSEKIILGLIANVEKRLLVTNSKLFVNEIIEIIKEIVIESSYMGRNAHRDKQSGFIEIAVSKRRRKNVI